MCHANILGENIPNLLMSDIGEYRPTDMENIRAYVGIFAGNLEKICSRTPPQSKPLLSMAVGSVCQQLKHLR